MQLAHLPRTGAGQVASIRDTSGTDRPVDPTPFRRRRRTILAVALTALLALAVGVSYLAAEWSAAEIAVPLERVRIAEVSRGSFVRDVSARGTVVAAGSPTLYAPAPGTVNFVVRAGDTVASDQVLARLVSPELTNELAREEATLASLEIAVERQAIETRRQILASQQASDLARVDILAAERELKRAEDSWAERLISERDYEKARDEAAAARLTHEHAIANAALERESLEFELRTRRLERDRQRLLVENLARRVDELAIRSPVDGIVGTLAVAERTAVAQNAALVTVVDLSAFEIEFSVPESYADDLGLGMQAEVSDGGVVYPATVSAVSPEVRESQVTGRLRFANAVPGGLRQNQRVAARIVLEARDGVIKVARGPFLEGGGGRVAYVVRDGIATRTPITLGATSIAEVEILSGLQPGDRIIVSSIDSFAGSASVRLAR